MSSKLRNTLISIVVLVALLLIGLFGGLFDDVLRGLDLRLAGHPPVAEAPAPAVSVAVVPAPKTDAVAPQPAGDEAIKQRVAPVFDLVRVEPSGDAVIAGQGVPDSKVEIMSGATVVASGKASDSGAWAIVLAEPLKPGAHDLSIRLTTPSGEVVTSSQSVAVSVPDGGKGEVLVVLNQPGAPSAVLEVPGAETVGQKLAEAGAVSAAVAETAPTAPASAVAPETPVAKADVGAAPAAGETLAAPAAAPAETAVPATGGETVVAQTAPAAPAAALAAAAPAAEIVPAVPAPAAAVPGHRVTVDAVEIENGRTFYAAGSAETGATIRLYVDDAVVGDVRTEAKGRWLYQGDLSIAAGRHMVRADEVDAAGKVLARAEVPFEIAPDLQSSTIVASGSGSAQLGTGMSGAAGGEPASIIIRHGDNLWTIARRLYGRGVRYSTIYQANTDQIRNPDLIYPGQVFVVPTGDEAWKPTDQ